MGGLSIADPQLSIGGHQRTHSDLGPRTFAIWWYDAWMQMTLSVKEELIERILSLSPEQAQEVLDWVCSQFEFMELTPEEEAAVAEGAAQIARGEYITGEELERKYGL
jgi:predicted transcriptional regulator